MCWKAGKALSSIAELQTVGLSVVINAPHVKANGLLGPALMEHRSDMTFSHCWQKRWMGRRVEHFSHFVRNPQCNCLTFVVCPSLCRCYIWMLSIAQLPPNLTMNGMAQQAVGSSPASTFTLTQTLFQVSRGSCFRPSPLDCCGAQADPEARQCPEMIRTMGEAALSSHGLGVFGYFFEKVACSSTFKSLSLAFVELVGHLLTNAQEKKSLWSIWYFWCHSLGSDLV